MNREQLLGILSENIRLNTLADVQRKFHQIEIENSLNSRLGNILIEGVDFPGSLFSVIGRLVKIWWQTRKEIPQESLEKLSAAYDQGEISAVEKLLTEISVSDLMQAKAFTVLARSLMSRGELTKAAKAARYAYVLDPKPYRLKWLVFRLHEAGEVFEAEALLDSLPPATALTESDSRQAEQLRHEALAKRLQEAEKKLLRIWDEQLNPALLKIESAIGEISSRINSQTSMIIKTIGQISGKAKTEPNKEKPPRLLIEGVKKEDVLVCEETEDSGFFSEKLQSSPQTLTQKISYLSSAKRLYTINLSAKAYVNAQRIFELLAPKDIVGVGKIRVGPERDGGYVMPELDYAARAGDGEVAYSFGVSHFSPWDLQMANYGYEVFQYDGTITSPPDKHPRMHFFRNNISGAAVPNPGERNLQQIFREHRHEDKNIILQCDIEGAEWALFSSAGDEEMNRFSQIIIEFHQCSNMKRFAEYCAIFEKINRTHQSIHLHANNCGRVLLLQGMRWLPNTFEVSYVRRSDYSFAPSHDSFPTKLDFPNHPEIPDIFLGKFSHSDAPPPAHLAVHQCL